MELLNKYHGAVFFVDILGITALTNRKMDLTTEDYSHWLEGHGLENSDQYLAAAILAEFRQVLMELNIEFEDVTITQLSDCAFIWSKSIKDVVMFANRFMCNAIDRGLLCRGGMSYGEIIETNQNHDLGRFIVGQAVTDAAKLEGVAKGARILIDQNLPEKLWKEDRDFHERISPLFAPFTNPLDYLIYDEFLWYLCPGLSSNVKDLNLLSDAEKIALTKKRLEIANQVRCAPKFNWNTRSKEGVVHVKATVNFIAQNYLLGIEHNFQWEGIYENRSTEMVQRIKKTVNEYPDYRIVVKPESEEWA